MNDKPFNWIPGLFLISYQVLLLLALPFYFYYATPSWGMMAISFVLLYITGLSITAGYHRLYAHRSYRTTQWVEAIILYFGSMAVQGSALRWAFDHRLHHAHVDTDNDPYSIKKGFWYAHFLWLLEKPRTIEEKVVSDLTRNKLVQFQHKHRKKLMLFTNLFSVSIVGLIFNDFIGAFFLAGLFRIFCLHHFTWFINSLAHTWGDKPFCQEQSAVNNYVIAFLTFGEGYHNYHHTFAQDYRNGIRWYHFDPTKWLIWTLHKTGLAYNLKRMDAYTIKKRLVLERKNLLLEKLCQLWYVKKDELEQKVNEISESLVTKIAKANELMEQYKVICQECTEKDLILEIRKELNSLKKSIKEDWRLWVKLSRNILRLKPLEV
ncbi:MAG: fatty acid desaturase [Parachlamydiaceae bacterium]|nr:fatty acid desaturase [Parachlamydiaceae bacterium]